MKPVGPVDYSDEKLVPKAGASGNVLQELDLSSNGKLQFKSGSVESEWDGDARFFFIPEVTNVKDKVDESLNLILRDLLSFLQGSHVLMRTDSLAPYLQEQCFKWMADVVKVLEARVLMLSENMSKATKEASTQTTAEDPKHALKSNSQGIPVSRAGFDSHSLKSGNFPRVVEQALFLGRLTAAVGDHSISLPLLLGSPTSWTANETALRQSSVECSPHILRQSLWSETNSNLEGSIKWFFRRRSGSCRSA